MSHTHHAHIPSQRRPAAIARALTAALLGAVLVATVLVAAPPAAADDYVSHHEFQVNCAVSHTASDDPIVYPGQPGASHNHTFLGNTSTDAFSTTESLLASGTTCLVPADHSAYWFPTLRRGDDPVLPNFAQVVYYKSGIEDYTQVVPFPQGLRFIAGDMMATADEFRTAPGAVEGFECGDSAFNWDIPGHCVPGSQLNVRYQAPSCWDGVNLDSPDHKRHMAYPVDTGHPTGKVCPDSHPVPVPMLEFKIAFPVDGDMSDVAFASGRGFSWHYDFVNAWEPETLAALVSHCINGGLQCDPRGYDQYKPHRGAVLDDNYELLP